MAIQTATDIRVPRRANWRTFDPINASDYETIIEGSHTLYQRLGQTVPGLYGDWRTTSTSYTTATSTSDRDLGTWEGSSRMFRDLETAGGNTRLRCHFSAIVKECRVRISVSRRDSDGTETSLGTMTANRVSSSLGEISDSLNLTEAQVSESGGAANDRALIVYTVEFRMVTGGTEAQMTMWHIDEYYSGTSLLP